MNAGFDLIKNNENQKAIDYFNKEISKNFLGLGSAKLKYDIDQSINDFEISLKYDSENLLSMSLLGEILLFKKELSKSLSYLLTIEKKSAKCPPQIFYLIACCYTDLNDYNNALAYLNKIQTEDESLKAFVYNSFGIICGKLEKLEESIDWFKKSANNFPDDIDTLSLNLNFCNLSLNLYLINYNIGLSYEKIKDHINAILYLGKALSFAQTEDNKNDCSLELGMNQLFIGDFSNGWKNYESRWESKYFKKYKSKYFEPPLIVGDFKDKTVLVYSEQGYGDSIQFIRYVSLLKKQSPAKIIVATHKPLVKLFSKIKEIDEIICGQEGQNWENVPRHDYRIPVMSFPFVFKTEFDTIPNENYLFVDEKDSEHWRSLMNSSNKPKIGICWGGDPKTNLDTHIILENKKRNVRLNQLKEIILNEKFDVYSLQKEDRENELVQFPNINNLMPHVKDYYDTACIISNLDLVIVVDTSVAHLAAGMGKNTWMLSRFRECWRWGVKEKCQADKWYPSMKIYRETELNNWNPIINQLKLDLIELFDT